MKRGWLFLIGLLVIATVAFVSAKTYDFSGCWGAVLCNTNFTCGTLDTICVDDFFAPDSEPANDGGCAKWYDDPGYRKCIDPDCMTCVQGKIIRAPPNPPDPIEGATIRYEQDVWDGNDVITITETTQTDEFGDYYMDIRAGNEIYILAQALGYIPALEGPFFGVDSALLGGGCLEVNFSLQNGTCENDCTRTDSNYCDVSCQGDGIPLDPGFPCVFNESTTFNRSDYGGYILIESPFSACTQLGIQKGTFLDIGNYTHLDTDEKMCIRVSCCEGAPFEVPCPEINVSETLISGETLENAIKVTRIAKYKGEPVKIRIYYWE